MNVLKMYMEDLRTQLLWTAWNTVLIGIYATQDHDSGISSNFIDVKK